MFERILVVCTGNICRSPVAEAMLRRHAPERTIGSAGLGALVGEGVAPQARALAEADGLDVSGHQARQLTTGMLEQSDLVLVMSDGQRQAIGRNHPRALGKTMRFGHWLDDGRGRDIPDPYGKSDEAFRQVHALLTEAAQSWAERLG
ncbi:low molecular weight protein-tyrosine-phosphatase [Thioalkalivibrio sp. ALE23]|uniref:low molecular weight protein-tyrosine-phosphatase n=1 Tax=Thioalkalivibrio sp. ALE23 TaxID=1265495 RepID=UPI00035DEC54|nr:low molecular weight protein-tyrosine-phosphatase [Thioalkalivibrio sp. ALE23]